MRKAIFIDKDGTLIRDVPYNVDPGLITLYDGAAEAICQWRQMGFLVIVISNQSGVAKGYFTEDRVTDAMLHLRQLLKEQGADIDDFYYCPHHPDGTVSNYASACSCRKPEPGMIVEAASKWNIDVANSWMIGDILNDVEAGNRAGCRTVLIDNGNETEWKRDPLRIPTLMAGSIMEAAGGIAEFETEKASYV